MIQWGCQAAFFYTGCLFLDRFVTRHLFVSKTFWFFSFQKCLRGYRIFFQSNIQIYFGKYWFFKIFLYINSNDLSNRNIWFPNFKLHEGFFRKHVPLDLGAIYFTHGAIRFLIDSVIPPFVSPSCQKHPPIVFFFLQNILLLKQQKKPPVI